MDYEYDYSPVPGEEAQPGDQEGEHSGHRFRLRDRLQGSLMDPSMGLPLLEFMLGCVLPRQDVAPVCRDMMEQFGTLKGVFQATNEELGQVEGLGENGVEWMEAVRHCLHIIRTAGPNPRNRLVNLKSLTDEARSFRRMFPLENCTLLFLANEDDCQLFRTVLREDDKWTDPLCLRQVLDICSSLYSRRAYLAVFTGETHVRPTAADKKALLDYALLMMHLDCRLTDVLFFTPEDIFSMRRSHAIPDEKELALHKNYSYGSAYRVQKPRDLHVLDFSEQQK